ncbi:response regulator transcription factor [Actinomadura algeriensis]|uniref:DNA-binding NarL/FixJ family response regulator n=1 Tax=Actinomadura algeriensis TaxID=1679523 RepID=A0ABR9JJJ5_9ACTN|nr:response regulator transcription factor [Actinomadura algeriensis]MBE1530717.1 DNA-binding NarL/FixJ family response regulator [Actinomadura algeriensis]
MTGLRVLIADDQHLVRAGLRSLLDRADDITVVAEAGDGLEAVELTRRIRPDVVLMDIRMPGIDGLEAARRIIGDPGLAAVRVVVLTTFVMDEYIFAALRAGAAGFLAKDIRPDDLRAAVRVAAAGEALLTPEVTRRVIEHFSRAPEPPRPDGRLAALTGREREVMAAVAAGASNREIAERLHMSPLTAKTHVTRIIGKLGVRDRAQVVVLAYEAGLVRPGDSAGSADPAG